MTTLAEVNKNLESQGKDISGIKKHIETIMKLQERSRLDALEEARERKNIKPIVKTTDGKTIEKSDSLFSNLLGMLPTLALPSLAALSAEIFGFDDYVRGLGIVDAFKNVKPTLKAIGTTFDDMAKGISSLNKNVLDKFDTFKINILLFNDKLIDMIDSIKLPKITMPDITLPRIVIPDIKIPDISLPKIPTDIFDGINTSITKVLDAVQPFVDKVKDVLGTGTGIVADIAKAGGRGILGFFSIVGSAFEVIKKIPFFGTAISVLVRPFTQFLITAFDFISGFVEGFRGSDASFIDPETGEVKPDIKGKIMAGLDKGVESVIKGILEGIDLIFFKLPGWILEKLGVPNPLADIDLAKFTDPIWTGIKNTFRFVFDSEYRSAQIAKFKEEFSITDIVRNFFQSMKDSVKSFFGFGENNQNKLQLEQEAAAISQTLQYMDPNATGPAGAQYKKLGQRLQEIEQQLSTESYYAGTSGFKNFGKGTAAMLHGSEAVVPERSAAGNILKSVNTQRVSDALTNIANTNNSYGMSAPVIIQDNSVKSGGSSNSTTINSMSMPTESHDASWYQRRATIGVGF
jgi:hypothetical protein